MIVAELAPGSLDVDPLAIERELRRAVVSALDVAVKHIFLRRERWIVKSTAGKPARAETRVRLLREHSELAAEAGMAKDVEAGV